MTDASERHSVAALHKAAILLAVVLLTASCGRREPTPVPEPPATVTPITAQSTAQLATTEPASDSESAVAEEDVAAAETAQPPVVAPSPTPIDKENTIVTSTGLQYTEIDAGTGRQPQSGDIVAVHYTGTLADGTVFDSSHNRGEPIRFPLGTGSVIAGWDEGIAMMAEGGTAVLVIPPDLAYGEAGAGGVIPPNATLIFDVELVEVAEGAPAAPAEVPETEYATTEAGLKYYDLVVGEGESPKPGQLVTVHYTGWLQDGERFDSSLYRGEPLRFNIGMGQVIPGWDLGLRDMKVGGRRQLVIPPALAYGEAGAGEGVIPPNATLVFEVELLAVQ